MRKSEEKLNKKHQLLVSKESIKGKVAAAVSGYGNELECFNNHLYSVSPFFVESMSCPFWLRELPSI